MSDLADLLARAVADNSTVLQGVKPDQWSGATPCSEWDLRALTNHITSELLWVKPLLEGKTIAEVGDAFDGDVVGDDPAAAYARAGTEAIEAARAPGAMTTITHLSFGDYPGEEYLRQILFDMTIHGWDVRAAAGADRDLADELVAEGTAYAAREVENWRAGGALAGAVEVGDDASDQDKLIALTGRSPAWPD